MPPLPAEGAAHPDLLIAEFAACQDGAVGRRQLLAAGVSKEAIRYRVRMRRLHPVHAGVYAVGHPHLSARGRYFAALLACGDDALLSHRSAGALLGLRPSSSARIDMVVTRGKLRRRPGIVVHTTRVLLPGDAATCEGLPCTSPARTLVDLAAVVSPRQLDRALEQSVILRLFDLTAIEAALAAAAGRRGTGTLRRLLAQLADEPPLKRSELERRFLGLVRGAGLPEPVVNGVVAGYEVDFHWPAQRLVVETDGGATHATPIAFERDRERDLDLESRGWRVIRISWRQLIAKPDQIRALLRSLLSR